mmetsp:Transcript_13593/g.22399  ORF Transcript_13593/g.22399 Transcript_13593/m.22399 type:complete len:295 (+) Transcript_13593:1392-2276(+)
MLKMKPPDEDLVIYEIGGGNGVCSANILDYLYQHHPTVYAKASYHLIEISEPLAKVQKERIHLHTNCHVRNVSAFDFHIHTPHPAFILLLEVLDNLGHDVVQGGMDLNWWQGNVSLRKDGTPYETFTRLSDPLIKRFLDYSHLPPRFSLQHLQNFPWPHKRRYLPTMALRLFEHLHDCFPRHRLIAADFTAGSFTGALPGDCGPAVQRTEKGHGLLADTYLVSKGTCDIFFPTDFGQLKRVYDRATGGRKKSSVASTCEFMVKHAETELEGTRCRDGYNPMVDDFANTAFLLSH